MMLGTASRVVGARIPGDFFYNYVTVFIFSSILMFVLAYMTPSVNFVVIRNKLYDWSPSRDGRVLIIISSLIITLLVIFGGDFARKFGVPVACFYLLDFCYRKKEKDFSLSLYIGCILSVVMLISQLSWRFVFVQYAFSLIMLAIFIVSLRKPNISFFGKVCVLSFIPVTLLYGVISEFYKINPDLSFEDVLTVFKSLPLLLDWLNRQSYRIFQIWTILSGNIIEHTIENGYYYGITYIKALSVPLGFEYVSLPVISASFVSATYAQPGIIAEGFANFGWLGSLISVTFLLVLSHLTWILFLNRVSYFTLVLVYAPFVSVILDGGSINSIVFNSILIGINFGLYFILKFVFFAKIGRRN